MSAIRKLLKDAFRPRHADFTEGNLRRALVVLAIPMILEMSMESLFAIVDVFFVARLGNEAVAAVGLTESLMFIIYSIGIGIAMAATAVVSRRVGEHKPGEAARAAAQAFYLSFFASALICLVGIFYSQDLLRLMNASDQVVNEYYTYTRWMLIGNFVILLLFLFNGVFRGAGDAFLAMIVLVVANSINIVLDPLLIFGIGPFPALGLEGAAIASVCGRGVGVLFQIVLLVRGVGSIKLRLPHFKLDFKLIYRVFEISLGGMGQFLVETASWIFLVRLISGFGDAVLAAYVITMRVIIFTLLPSIGLANASATLVGQNLGAGKPDRSERAAWLAATWNVIFLSGVSILFFFSAPYVLGIFTEDPEVVREGVRATRIICTGYIAFAFGMVLGQSFNGAGDTRTPTVVNLICFWFIQIPLAYYMAKSLGWGSTGVYIAIALGHSLVAAVFVVLFRRGKWKEVQV